MPPLKVLKRNTHCPPPHPPFSFVSPLHLDYLFSLFRLVSVALLLSHSPSFCRLSSACTAPKDLCTHAMILQLSATTGLTCVQSPTNHLHLRTRHLSLIFYVDKFMRAKGVKIYTPHCFELQSYSFLPMKVATTLPIHVECPPHFLTSGP